jgi:hypothetical protein
MTTATDQTNRLFTESVLAEDARGYPHRTSFIARDTPDWAAIVWRNLVDERRPTVIVDEDALEIMLIPVDRPLPLAWLDRARGRVPVRVGWRQHDSSHAYEVPVSLSRSRLAALEPGAPALA